MKLSDWIWEKMENLQDAGFRWKPTLKFCHQVLRLDYNAIADSLSLIHISEPTRRS